MLNHLIPEDKIDGDETRELKIKCSKETDEYIERNTVILEITTLQRCACRAQSLGK